MNYYSLAAKKIIEDLNSSEKTGLSITESKNRLKKYGPNILPQEKPFTIYKVIINQLLDPMILILIAAAILTYIIGHLQDLYIILAIIILEIVIGFVEEYRSDKIVEALTHVSKTRTKALREGEWQNCFSDEIVPGDIVRVDSGDKISADIRLLSCDYMAINESIFSGEAELKEKKAVIVDIDTPLNDRINMLYQGTTVSIGSGVGIVVNTGRNTEFGKISLQTITTKRVKTPLQKKISSFTKGIAVIVGIVAILFIIIGLFLGKSLYEIIILTISISVSAIPESFPIIVSICLVSIMAKLAKKKVVVKHLPAAETLGSTSIICLDKTGTLTENKLAVKKIILPNNIAFSIDKTDYSPEGNFFLEGEKIKVIDYPHLDLLLLAGTLCNDSKIKKNKQGNWVPLGDPTEAALFSAAAKANLDPDKIINDCPREETIPFISGQNYMTTLNLCPQKNKKYIFLKGSPESIMEKCGYQMVEDKIVKLSVYDKKNILATVDNYTQKSYRIVALAYKETALNSTIELNDTTLKYGIIYLGLVLLVDPIRPTARQSFQIASEAGLKTLIITGDHVNTAINIAKSIGLKITEKNSIVGEELEKLSMEEYEKIAEDIKVYARILPEQKMRIIQYWQKKGHVVAMTGDGINDAPALKKADVGIAMGTGTDVAKEAAEIILLDNDFSRIIDAIKYGRLIYENLKKTIIYLLGHNLGEIGIIFIALILQKPLPLVASQILWINLVTDGLIDETLIFEEPEENIMNKPPKSPNERLISPIMLRRIFTIGLTMIIISIIIFNYYLQTTNLEYARTVIFALVSFFSIFGVYSCRSISQLSISKTIFTNKYLNYAAIFTIGIQIMILYFKPLRDIFMLQNLSLKDFSIVLGSSILFFGIIELAKYLELHFVKTKTVA